MQVFFGVIMVPQQPFHFMKDSVSHINCPAIHTEIMPDNESVSSDETMSRVCLTQNFSCGICTSVSKYAFSNLNISVKII